MKEQSILLTLRHQLAALGYPESVIDSQEDVILNFSKMLITSADIVNQPKTLKTTPARTESDDTYMYYMYINNPAACTWLEEMYPDKKEWIDSYRNSIKGFIFDTFESDCDWDRAVNAKDIDTCQEIYDEVLKFCKTNPVPHEVITFIEKTPNRLANRDWRELQYNGIVDAYCDQSVDEYVNLELIK